jgi:aspartate kinase
MSTAVMKFGGTSVGSIERIINVANMVQQKKKKYDSVIVVVSAMAGETDRLINLLKPIDKNYNNREYDMMVSTGEQVSIALMAQALISKGCKAISFTGWQAGISTDISFSKARIININAANLRFALDNEYVCVVAGFQGITVDGKDITTLGRGGSDTTAVAIAAAIKADVCEIYTDVDGVYTADPRKINMTKKLDKISYEEMLELASLGAKVLHSRSVELAMKFNVPLMVLSSIENKPGTLVTSYDEKNCTYKAAGVALSDEVKFIISINSDSRIVKEVISQLSKDSVDFDMLNITDSNFSFYVKKSEADKAKFCLEKCSIKGNIDYIEDLSKLSIVGFWLNNNDLLFNRILKLLSEENIVLLDSIKYNIRYSFIFNKSMVIQAANLIHNLVV